MPTCRAEVAARHSARGRPASNGVTLAWDGTSGGRDRDLGSFEPGVSLFQESPSTDEVMIPRDDPSESGFKRCRLFVEILSPERIPHFEPERVAGAKPTWNGAGMDQILHELCAAIGRNGDLSTSFPGVAGSRSDRPVFVVATLDYSEAPRHRPQHSLNDECGARSLNGQERRLGEAAVPRLLMVRRR